MKRIKEIFKGEESLMELEPVNNLIEYCQDLEGMILEREISDNYSKEKILKFMISDILSSCEDYERDKELEKRFPDPNSPKVDSDSIIKNLMKFIRDMDEKNNLGI